MKKWILVFILVCLAIITLIVFQQRAPKEVFPPQAMKEKEKVVLDAYLPEATNSEGNLKLVGMERIAAGGGKRYQFKVVDVQNNKELSLYETLSDPEYSMTIPRNSWSPDYKQVFVKTTGPGGDNYYLFRANGENFADGKKYIAIGDYWAEANMTTKIDRITGWAGDDLLMVYTKKEDGKDGPAYWFVTSTRKFMQVREF